MLRRPRSFLRSSATATSHTVTKTVPVPEYDETVIQEWWDTVDHLQIDPNYNPERCGRLSSTIEIVEWVYYKIVEIIHTPPRTETVTEVYNVPSSVTSSEITLDTIFLVASTSVKVTGRAKIEMKPEYIKADTADNPSADRAQIKVSIVGQGDQVMEAGAGTRLVSSDPASLTMKEETVSGSSFTTEGIPGSNPAKVSVSCETNEFITQSEKKEITVAKIAISRFYPHDTYVMHSGCIKSNHQSTCLVSVEPEEVRNLGLTYKFKDDTDPFDAEIDSDGIITPGTNRSGKVTPRVEIQGHPNLFAEKEFLIKARPLGISSSKVFPSPFSAPGRHIYGGEWVHTFKGTGGNLEGYIIGEEVHSVGIHKFYLPVSGNTTWDLDSNG